MTWKKYLTDFNEGLGVVYERFVLNDYLLELTRQHNIQSVLEAPLFGMAGVSGINSYALAQHGCQVTLVDNNWERLTGVQRIWDKLQTPVNLVWHPDFSHLPFDDNSFDLAWEWAGLWYLPDAAGLLQELVRVSRKLVFVAMPNNLQVGYLLRKYLIDRDFFNTIDERWVDMSRVKQALQTHNLNIIDEGVLDVPPWPDTVMPAAEVLKRLKLNHPKLEARFSGNDWTWSTMDYYLGHKPELYDEVMRYAWLDRINLPWQLKLIWAHHHYLLGRVPATFNPEGDAA